MGIYYCESLYSIKGKIQDMSNVLLNYITFIKGA